jgi:hypothetical protein
MAKFYRRIQINTTNYFSTVLPITTMEWRTSKHLIRKITFFYFFFVANQQTSNMIIACDKLLKPIISQSECLNIDNKLDIYENILSSFIQAWTTILLERKYRFS